MQRRVFDDCVWVALHTRNDPNLLNGKHYFSPDIKPDIIRHYFFHLENKLDMKNFRIILLGDFNIPLHDLRRGLPIDNCYFYSKLGEMFITPPFFALDWCSVLMMNTSVI